MHPYWVENGLIDNLTKATPGVKVNTSFADQKPIQSKKELIEEAKLELDSGLTSKKRALQKINPDLNDDEIEALLLEITEEQPEPKNVSITTEGDNSAAG